MDFRDAAARPQWFELYYPILARAQRGIPVVSAQAPSRSGVCGPAPRYVLEYWNRHGWPLHHTTRPSNAEALLDAGRIAVHSGQVAVAAVTDVPLYGEKDGVPLHDGLVAVALSLWQAGLIRTAVILDFGTSESGMPAFGYEEFPWLRRFPIGEYFWLPYSAASFFCGLRTFLRDCAADRPDLLIVRLAAREIASGGRGFLTRAEYARRDRMVFEAAAGADIPLMWCLGGWCNGSPLRYTVEAHNQTMRECVRVYAGPALRRQLSPTGE